MSLEDRQWWRWRDVGRDSRVFVNFVWLFWKILCVYYIGWVSVVSADERPASHAEFCICWGVTCQRFHSSCNGRVSEQHSRPSEVSQSLSQICRTAQWKVWSGRHQLSCKTSLDWLLHKSQSKLFQYSIKLVYYPCRLCRLVWVGFSSPSVCLSVCLSTA